MHVDLIPFLALSALLILIPGPDTAIVTKNALLGGRRGGVYAAVGVSIGLTVWTIAAAVGIAALLKASAAGFLVLKLVGAIYLVWMGVQMLRVRSDYRAMAVSASTSPQSRAKALRQGVFSDLSNPKIAVFFTSFLPQFIHGGGALFAALLGLGATFALLTLLWLALYGMLIGGAAGFLRRRRVRMFLDRFTGVVLIAFGIRLALERR